MESQLDKSSWSVCEVFSRALPQFLAIGMPLEVFYEGHSWLAVSYKKAYAIKREQDNFDKYLMGAYIYDIIQRNAAVFNPFVKEKVKPYMDGPFELQSKSDSDSKISGNAKGAQGAARAFMEQYMFRHNAAMAADVAMGGEGPDPQEQ